MVGPILDALVAEECEFVVVGSAARELLGTHRAPADLDLVVPDEPGARCRVISVLSLLGGWICTPNGRRRVDTRWLPATDLLSVITAFGRVDVVTRFGDGTGFEEHLATSVELGLNNGGVVRVYVGSSEHG
jgi:hypothetical protein